MATGLCCDLVQGVRHVQRDLDVAGVTGDPAGDRQQLLRAGLDRADQVQEQAEKRDHGNDHDRSDRQCDLPERELLGS
jgi:hypothetical protein